MKTLGFGAALSGFDFSGDGCSTSDFRRFVDRSAGALFDFFDAATDNRRNKAFFELAA